jgi:site-specific recombinase XerD
MNRADCPNELDEERIRALLPKLSARDAMLIELGFETGLRLSEMLSLTIGSVWKGGAPVSVLRATRSCLKGGSGVRARSVASRAIPVNERAREAIVRYLGERPTAAPAEPLFLSREGGEALCRRQGTRIIRDIFLAAGLDPARAWGGHSLRKRFVRRVYDLTGDINTTRAAAGHRWIQTTQIYLGMAEEEAAAAILRLGRVETVQVTRTRTQTPDLGRCQAR